jgi:hypothetical protein
LRRSTIASSGRWFTYRATWSRFDNVTGATQVLGETRHAVDVVKAPRPADLPSVEHDFLQIDVRAEAGGAPGWQRPVRLHFRRTVTGWVLVGLDRQVGRAHADAHTAAREE